MTFPSLMVLAFSLVAAAMAAYIPRKYLAAAGCGLFCAGGTLSWLFHGSLSLLFVWAAPAGIGIGLVVPMATSLVPDCFEGAERQSMMGLQSSAANIGAMLMTLIGGLRFGKLAAKLGRKVMAFGFGMMALGQMVCAFAPNLAMVFAGCLVCGRAISSVMPQTTLDAAAQSGGKAAGAAALVMASSNLGGFCSPLLTMAAQLVTGSGATAFRFILSAVCALAAAIIIVVRVRK